MRNKLLALIRRYEMLAPGDTLYCAVSGGADSMALLWAMRMLAPQLGIQVRAAHFNHRLRPGEADRDEAFVRDFCRKWDIPLTVGSGRVLPGGKGLEAAAREARYAFLLSLPGKIATAHTADDNAETVLMRLVRGTGLTGLGAIAPVAGAVVRPMLTVTRREVLAFLAEYQIEYVEDSSNASDAFLRNRLRHDVMPLLRRENPRIAENLSAMAMRLREDGAALDDLTTGCRDVAALRQMPRARRGRELATFLKQCGVKEPEAEHIALAEGLVFSENPSARADFPGGVTVGRRYGELALCRDAAAWEPRPLPCPGSVELPESGARIVCRPAGTPLEGRDCFTVTPVGAVFVRARLPGDAMRLPGGVKSLKRLFIDKKLPQSQRQQVPVVADERGVLGVYGFGPNRDRLGGGENAVEIRFETFGA